MPIEPAPPPHLVSVPGSVRRHGALLLLAALTLIPGTVEAQFSISQYGEGSRSRPILEGLPEIPGGFTFCRLQYNVVRSFPRGLGWSTDYPGGDHNLTLRLSELTTTWISRWAHGDPGMAVVTPTDPDLFRCPFLFTSDPGTIGFSQADADALREYFMKGGLLWVDDFWGNAAWDAWSREIAKALPEYDIVDIPMDHPLMSIVYQVDEIPQIPAIQFWRQSGGQTSELGAESAVPHLRGIFHEDGRIMVLMSHNTDIADGWEREMDDDAFFLLFSPDAYAVGINVLVWSMTH